MAKGRLLSQDASTDPHLNTISIEAQLLYILTIPHLDRDGLIDGTPTVIWSKAAPRRIELLDKITSYIQEWTIKGLVIQYDGPDRTILWFKGFRKHNSNLPYAREPESKYPPPPGHHRTQDGIIPNDPDLARRMADHFDSRSTYHKALMETSGELPEVSMKSSGKDHAEVNTIQAEVQQKVREVKSTEVNTKRDALEDLARELAPDLDGWIGADAFISNAEDRTLCTLITWLWLNDLEVANDMEIQLRWAQYYSSIRPFERIDNRVGYILTNAKGNEPAPLHRAHKIELLELLSNRLQSIQEDTSLQTIDELLFAPERKTP